MRKCIGFVGIGVTELGVVGAFLGTLAFASPTVYAQETGASRYSSQLVESRSRAMPSSWGLSVTGGFGISPLHSSGSNLGDNLARTKAHDNPGSMGGVSLSYGSRSFAIETGVYYLNLPMTVETTEVGNPNQSYKIKLANSYVGVPLVIKYNYLESSRQIFSVKTGVLSAFSNRNSLLRLDNESGKNLNEVTIKNQDLMLLVGFGGSAPFFGKASLILDMSYLKSISPVASTGAVNQAVLFSAGLLFFL